MQKAGEPATRAEPPDPGGPAALPFAEPAGQAIWESALDGMRLADAAGRVWRVNDAYCQLVRQPRAALEGHPLCAPYLPALHAQVLRRHQNRFTAACLAPREEVEVVLAAGERLVLELRNSLVSLPGQPPLLLSVFRDITARTQAEALARAEAARLRMALEVARMVTWEWDIPTGRIRYSDNLDLLTHGREQVPFESLDSVVDRMHPEDRPPLAAALERTLAESCPFDCEYRLRMLDGEWHWIHSRGRLVIVENGRPIRVIGVSQDISERKQAEAEIRRLNETLEIRVQERTQQWQAASAARAASEARYQRLHESMTDAFATADMTGLIQESNRAYQEMLGYTESELRQLRYPDLTPARWHAPEAAVVEEQVMGRGFSDLYEKEYRHRDGHVFPVELRTILLRDEAGQPTGMWAIVRDISRRKAAEAAIQQLNASLEERVRASEARVQQLAEGGRVGLWQWEIPTNTAYFSPELKRQLGYSGDEMPGLFSSWEQRLHPEDRAATLQELHACLAEPGREYSVEFRLQHRNGSYRTILAQGTVTRDAHGTPVRMLGSHVDLTERRAAEQQVRQLSRAVEQSPASVVITDPQGRIEYVNAKFTAVSGYRLDEVRGQTPRLLKSGHSPPESYAQLWQTITSGREWRGEFLNRRKQGELFWELASISPIVDGVGRITHFLAVKEDITEQKQALAELADSEQRFRTLFEAAPVAIAVHGADGRFLQVNPAYAQMLGLTAAELMQTGIRRVTHPEDVTAGQRLHEELVAGRRDQYQRDKRFVRSDGRLVWAKSAAAAVRDEAGGLRYIISIVDDITPQRRAAECTAAFARLGQVLSAASSAVEAGRIIIETASTLFAWDACVLNLASLERHEMTALFEVDTIDGQKVATSLRPVPSPLTPMVLGIMVGGARLFHRPEPRFDTPGVPPTRPFGDRSRPAACLMYVPLRAGNKALGMVSLQSYTPGAYSEADLATFQALADHCGGALERIQAEAATRQLEAEVLEAGNVEQTRIGCELHDGVAQSLGGLSLRAKLLAQTMREAGLPATGEAEAFTRLLNQVVGEVRRLARGLAPVGLELHGLPAALSRLTLDAQEQGGLPCAFACNVEPATIQPGIALHLFRIAQEAVSNALRHGQPQRIQLSLTAADGQLTLTVADDGQGFDPHLPGTGMGRHSMNYRAHAIGARLDVRSQPGQGTEICCHLAESQWRCRPLSKEPHHESKTAPESQPQSQPQPRPRARPAHPRARRR